MFIPNKTVKKIRAASAAPFYHFSFSTLACANLSFIIYHFSFSEAPLRALFNIQYSIFNSKGGNCRLAPTCSLSHQGW